MNNDELVGLANKVRELEKRIDKLERELQTIPRQQVTRLDLIGKPVGGI